MVQSMLDTGAQESSSDEENENEFESLKDKLKKAGLGKALDPANAKNKVANDSQLM